MTEPTMRELVESTPELTAQNFDYALPQAWVDDMVAKTGEWPYGFVWIYDEQARIWGRPFAVTPEAKALLERYEEVSR